MTAEQEISDFVIKQVTEPIVNSGLSFFNESAITLVGIIALAIGGFMIVSAVKHYTAYAGHGEPLGIYRLVLQGKYEVIGNLSVNEDPTLDKLKRLKNIPEFTEGIEYVEDLMKEDGIHWYDFKATDHLQAWQHKGGDSYVIVSRVKLDDGGYSWADKKGIFSFVSAGFKARPRTIIGSELSTIYPTEDEFGNDLTVLNLVPFPRSAKKKTMETLSEKELYEITLNVLPESDAIGRLGRYMSSMFKVYKSLDEKDIEIKNSETIITKQYKELQEANLRMNGYKNLLKSKELIVYGKKLTPLEKASDLIWMVATGLACYFLPTEMIKMELFMGTSPLIIFFGVLAGAVIIRKITDNNKPTEDILKEQMKTGAENQSEMR